MAFIKISKDKYIADSLYQWDLNQVFKIYGLALPRIPEIHFTNEAMSRAIVRQATMSSTGVISVDIPNSLLQHPYKITAHICSYDGDTFESLYTVHIPVKARKKPMDYTIEDSDGEIYSFNGLENLLNNTLVDLRDQYTELNAKYEETNSKYNETVEKANESNEQLETAIDLLTVATANAEQAKEDHDVASETYNAASEMVNQFVENYGDILTAVQSKADKPTVVEATLSVSGWSGNTYSFENVYPVKSYNIEIAVNSTATIEQVEAFNYAQIVGSATTNIIKAYGTVPTIDIPIIIKAVKV